MTASGCSRIATTAKLVGSVSAGGSVEKVGEVPQDKGSLARRAVSVGQGDLGCRGGIPGLTGWTPCLPCLASLGPPEWIQALAGRSAGGCHLGSACHAPGLPGLAAGMAQSIPVVSLALLGRQPGPHRWHEWACSPASPTRRAGTAACRPGTRACRPSKPTVATPGSCPDRRRISA